MRIKIVGIGDTGRNAINRMVEEGLRNVSYIYVDTSINAVATSKAESFVQIGKAALNGISTGSNDAAGRIAAQESKAEIEQAIKNSDVLIIIAGMGGGTGTGAAPAVADIAKALATQTAAVVTLPFSFEGKRRAARAKKGVAELKGYASSLYVISNEALKRKAAHLAEAYVAADEEIVKTVKDIIESLKRGEYLCKNAIKNTPLKMF